MKLRIFEHKSRIFTLWDINSKNFEHKNKEMNSTITQQLSDLREVIYLNVLVQDSFILYFQAILGGVQVLLLVLYSELILAISKDGMSGTESRLAAGKSSFLPALLSLWPWHRIHIIKLVLIQLKLLPTWGIIISKPLDPDHCGFKIIKQM